MRAEIKTIKVELSEQDALSILSAMHDTIGNCFDDIEKLKRAKKFQQLLRGIFQSEKEGVHF